MRGTGISLQKKKEKGRKRKSLTGLEKKKNEKCRKEKGAKGKRV